MLDIAFWINPVNLGMLLILGLICLLVGAKLGSMPRPKNSPISQAIKAIFGVVVLLIVAAVLAITFTNILGY